VADNPSVDLFKIIQALRQIKHNITVPMDFDAQMELINNTIYKNDKTGIVSTVLDFMCHSANVPLNIETKNDTLDAKLYEWQKSILNRDINIGIPRGLKELSTQYFIERWKSSFVALNVQWGEVDFGANDSWIMPIKMWFADGSSIIVDGNESSLIDRKYYLDRERKKPLITTRDKSVLVRKPFNPWYCIYPTPFLVKRGILFNALLKNAIIDKQAEIIQQIIPYLLLLKSGSDKLAELNMLASKEEMKALKDGIINAVKDYDTTGELGKLLAPLSYDVNVEHLIPDLTKIFNPNILQASDKNILAGLGMIEIEGFSKNRQETILNPKMLVEEVKDAVSDWVSMLEEVMYQMLDKNKAKFPRLTTNEIRVVPGLIKSFLTSDMKEMIRGLYDRGLISKQNFVEDVGEFDFEVQVERRQKETERKLDDTLYPPIVQNYEQYLEPSTNPNLENQDKKPGSPESKNFKYADLEVVMAPYENIDELPESIRKALPVAAQLIFLKAFNSAIKSGHKEEDAFQIAWSAVKKIYFKDDDGKWIKKSK